MSNQNRNRNRGGSDFPFVPILIFCAIFIPGFLSVGLPLFILYEVFKNVVGIDLIEEIKKALNIQSDSSDRRSTGSTIRTTRSGQSSVRKTSDPCGNEGYHSTFGEAGTYPSAQKQPHKASTQEDPCGNDAYHGTFHEDAPKQRRHSFFSKKIRDGKTLSIVGTSIFALFAFCSIIEAAELLPAGASLFHEDFLSLAAFSLSGLGLLAAGRFRSAKAKRFRKLRNLIGENNRHISIHALAEAMPCSYKKAEDLIQQMIDEGLLGDSAYIDGTNGYLILDGQGLGRDEAPAPAVSEEQKAKQMDRQELDTLAEIRRVNNQIPDPVMTRKISRIEEITGHILAYQRKHPDKAPELRKFLNYYLPTTLKILNSYAELDHQGLSGENINVTKERIENMMDNVVEGFETQLDKLFEGDMMDISSDIAVMEKMLNSDGLTGGMKVSKSEPSPADEAFQQLHLTTEPAPQPAVTFPTEGMFPGQTAEAAAPSADEMFQSIRLTLEPDKEEESSAPDWESGFYRHTKEDLE